MQRFEEAAGVVAGDEVSRFFYGCGLALGDYTLHSLEDFLGVHVGVCAADDQGGTLQVFKAFP